MSNTLLLQLMHAKQTGTQKLAEMDVSERIKLEDHWDVEHAYYSSLL